MQLFLGTRHCAKRHFTWAHLSSEPPVMWESWLHFRNDKTEVRGEKTFPKGHPERAFELNCLTPESILLIWILKLKSLSHWTNGLQILFPKDEGDKNSRILPQLFFCCFITTVQCRARWIKKPQPCFKNSLKFLHLLCSLSKPALYRTWNPTACFVGCSDWLKEKPDWLATSLKSRVGNSGLDQWRPVKGII